MSDPPATARRPPDPLDAGGGGSAAWETAALFALFLIFSLLATPVPGINEPHYLCKAKHFWDAGYCPGDFFLDSADAHYVFYATFGLLTRWLSLESTALVGRVAGLLLLAWGWTALCRRVVPRPGTSLLTGLWLVALSAVRYEFPLLNFSGEWVVGGIESKVIAYGCVLAAWGLWCDGRRCTAAALLGAGISFHPVVGGWSLVASLYPAAADLLWRKRPWPAWRSLVAPSGLLILTALPGLIPAVAMLSSGSADSAAADRIQVFERLSHHLDPSQFPLASYLLYGVLLAVWWGLRRRNDRTTPVAARRWWNDLVVGSLLIAAAGLLIGFLRFAPLPESAQRLLVTLMKFYPFRLFDALLPLAFATEVLTAVGRRPEQRSWAYPAWGAVCLGAAAWVVLARVPDVGPHPYTGQTEQDWIAVCKWMDRELPPDALVITPSSAASFKWYASRAQYFAFKDCPQDAAGLLEWESRRHVMKDWFSTHYNDEFYSRDELAELREVTGATHLVAQRLGPLEADPIHRNESFRVYELP